MWIKVGNVVIPTGKPLYVRESGNHITANLHRSRSALSYAYGITSGLCHAAHLLQLQDKLS